MTIVKITILLSVVSYIYAKFVFAYWQEHPKEYKNVLYKPRYFPKYAMILYFLLCFNIIGVLASLIWLLFFM